MSASAPPTWHWRDECYVPVETPEAPDSATFSKQNDGEALSADSRNLSGAATLGVQNDSPDPTYRGCLPSERYPSDAPGPEHVESCVSEGSREHRIGTCYLDPDTGETVMPADFFGEKELRWMPGKDGNHHDAEPVATVDSCPECGAVTDIDYAPEQGVIPKRETRPVEETPDVPFGVQSFIFEELAEVQAEYLHDILKDHTPLIVEMARDRFRKGFAKYGSAAYLWDAETRLTNVLEELADSVVYLTTGAIE